MIMKRLDKWADNKTQKEFNNIILTGASIFFIAVGFLSMVIDSL